MASQRQRKQRASRRATHQAKTRSKADEHTREVLKKTAWLLDPSAGAVPPKPKHKRSLRKKEVRKIGRKLRPERPWWTRLKP